VQEQLCDAKRPIGHITCATGESNDGDVGAADGGAAKPELVVDRAMMRVRSRLVLALD
jgi:hypothetical protein